MIGRSIMDEALARSHEVTAIARHVDRISDQHERLTVAQGDVTDAAQVAGLIAGHDVVVNAVSLRYPGAPAGLYVDVAHNLLNAMRQTGVPRLMVVGGAGSLEVAPGVQMVDTPEFPETYKPEALSQRDTLHLLRGVNDVEWTYFSPALWIEPGEKRGHYRTGLDQMVFDAEGKSNISNADYAVALLDELERPQFTRRRFTAAY